MELIKLLKLWVVARIRNTRIPVWSLVQSRQMGASDLEILEAYPALTQADLINA
jgi:uncharacterized protein (DUF433 family)